MRIIICDEINSGKSTLCLALARRLVDDGLRLCGFVTPAHMEDGKKRGHDFVAIAGDRMETPIPFTRLQAFAGSVQFPDFSGFGIRDPGSDKHCPYHFNSLAFERAERMFRIGHPESRLPDLIVMDEIGPLELNHRAGFHDALAAAAASGIPLIAVVRRGLEARFMDLVGRDGSKIYNLDEAAGLEAQIAAFFGRQGHEPSRR